MDGLRELLLAFSAGMAALWWGTLGWMLLVLRSQRRRGIERDKLQDEAVAWLLALARGFTGLVLVVWAAG
ncbi:MAG: hypothetical protein K2X82_01050 [Gemmataceae bacterium]|nr:hypothetical protein [Gemmataceae bacterium]